ncbi:MAG: recombination protein RecR [Candidatus Latescibacteria bacterium]|nr:recombination protein RecR [Candidatus Latescibacterota bacterium]
MGPVFIEELIAAFQKFPGVGKTTAERYAYFVLKQSAEEAEILPRAILQAKENIQHCSECFNFTQRDRPLCDVCTDPKRDRQVICVVAEASEVVVFERDRLIRGEYHVLGGLLSPLDNIKPEDLRIDELVARVEKNQVREVIIALNASPEGEATAGYIYRLLQPSVEVTRLARGLPAGSDLSLADRMTLAHALDGRRSF